MNETDIRRLFHNASASCIAANQPELFRPPIDISAVDPLLQKLERRPRGKEGDHAAVRPELERHPEPRALGKREAKEGNPVRFLVRITSRRRRIIDEDNLNAKYICDCCRFARLIPDDCPGTTRIETRQEKVGKGEAESTEVEIFKL